MRLLVNQQRSSITRQTGEITTLMATGFLFVLQNGREIDVAGQQGAFFTSTRAIFSWRKDQLSLSGPLTMFLYALVLQFDAFITFFLAMRDEPTTERAQMTEAINRQASDVPRFARRLEESSLGDAETTSPKEMLPDARATDEILWQRIADETAISRAAEICYALQNDDSNQLIDAVYDDRFGAESALHL